MAINILRQLIEVSFCVADIFLLYEFSKIFKFELKVDITRLMVINIFTIFIVYIIGYFYMFTSVNEILSIIILIIYYFLIFKGKLIIKIFAPILFQLVLGIITVTVSLVYLFISNSSMDIVFDSTLPRVIITLTIKVIMFILIQFVLRHKNESLKNIQIPIRNILAYICFNLLVLMLAFEVIFLENKYLEDSLLIMFLVVFIVSFIVINVLLVRYYRNKDEIKTNQLLLEEYKLKQQNYISNIKNQMDVMKLKHDMRNHLITIRTLISNNQYAKTIDYIDSLQKTNALKPYISTNNDVVNAILNSKINEFPDIQFKFNIDINYFEIDMVDLTVLLGNLIDNAIEAVNKLPIENRVIRISLSENNQYCKLSISNEYAFDLTIENSEFISSKEKNRKGFGIKNIKSVIEKYNGSYEINTENRIFKFTIVLKKV